MKFSPVYLTLALTNLYSAQDKCSTDPTGSDCSGFTISDSDANKALDSICKNQKTLNGCSLRSMCTANTKLSTDLCSPVAVLATVCTTDAASDSNCSNYNAVCMPNTGKTAVKQCSASIPFPSMPPTKNLTNLLLDGCNQMPNMKDCTVVGNPVSGLLPIDNLSVYGAFCKDMPNMSQCKIWKSMCQESKNFDPICENPKYGDSGSSSGTQSSGNSTPTTTKSSDATVQFGLLGAAAMMVSSAVLLVL